jgi:hypothetical protein
MMRLTKIVLVICIIGILQRNALFQNGIQENELARACVLP